MGAGPTVGCPDAGRQTHARGGPRRLASTALPRMSRVRRLASPGLARAPASLLSFVGARRDFGAGCLALPVPVPAGTPKTRTGTGIPKHAPAAARAGTGPSKIPVRRHTWRARAPGSPSALCPSQPAHRSLHAPFARRRAMLLRKCDLWQWEGVIRLPTPDIPRRKPPSDCQYPTFLGAHPPGTAFRRRPRCHNSHFLSTPPRHSPADAPRARPQFH
jgi:hypothetical protein